MRLFFIVSICALATGCGASKSDLEDIKAETERLKIELRDLRKRNDELESVEKPPKVVLSDTELRELKSDYTGQTYKIKVKFPRDYQTENEEYPVLYVIDAETNFGGVSYIVQRLVKDRLIPKILIVGVAYGTDYDEFYRLRSRDLTPTEDRDLRIGGASEPDPTGGAARFADFFEFELFSFVEENYRVKKNDRTLYGHSYGGLYGCYVLMNRARLFNRYLLLSPSLWYNDSSLLREIGNVTLQLEPTRLYMASGGLEGRIDDLQVEFTDRIRRLNPANLQMKSEVLENETHRTIFGAGFTNGLRFLFDPGN